MIPEKNKIYYIDFHEGDECYHFHGEALCVDDQIWDIDGPCYDFEIPNWPLPVHFPVESIIRLCPQP